MTGDADELKTALLTRIEAASDLKELDDVRVEALGKKGRITEQMKGWVPWTLRPARLPVRHSTC